MKVYEKSSLIECELEDLYAFHTDMKNLKAISPKGIKVTLVNEDFVPREGEILRLKTVKNFIPIVWEVKIERMDAPYLLVDVAMKSPFKSWKHSHMFKQLGDRLCELKDRVEYVPPFGFLGSLFNFFIKYELEKMFTFRHEVTKQLLESKK